MSFFKTFSAVVCTFLLISCSENSPSTPPITTDEGTIQSTHSSYTRDLNPNIVPADLQQLVDGNTAFAVEFYHQLNKQGNANIFYSPYSVSLALAMTYAGARGETQRQMAQTLHYTLDTSMIHQAFNALDLALTQRANPAKGVTLNIVNSTWGQIGFPFKQQFADIQKINYGADIRLVDFAGLPEQCRLTINSWVSDNTMQKIENLIPQNAISPNTALVLVNAIYFNGLWQTNFDKALTTQADFHLSDNSVIQVPMMAFNDSVESSFPYVAGDNYQAVELPFKGDELSLVVMLPTSGAFESFERELTARTLHAIITSMQEQKVKIQLPKLKLSTPSISLVDILMAMGMPIAFSEGADFSGIADEGLYISDVFHKAYLALDENGAEAAAATAVILDSNAVEPSFIVDRPFIFTIRDNPTGTILFMGKIGDPLSN